MTIEHVEGWELRRYCKADEVERQGDIVLFLVDLLNDEYETKHCSEQDSDHENIELPQNVASFTLHWT